MSINNAAISSCKGISQYWTLAMKIILLHGLYMHSIIMQPLHRRLKADHHQILNISYNSVHVDFKSLFSQMDDFINNEDTLIIAHSMGGVIVRHYLESDSKMTTFIKKVITLGTPHQGSKMASTFNNMGLGSFLFRNSKSLLICEKTQSWPDNIPLFSLAGNMPIGLASVMFFGKESDGTVLLDETKIDGMTSHEIFPLTHMGLIFSKRVNQRIIEIINLDNKAEDADRRLENKASEHSYTKEI